MSQGTFLDLLIELEPFNRIFVFVQKISRKLTVQKTLLLFGPRNGALHLCLPLILALAEE